MPATPPDDTLLLTFERSPVADDALVKRHLHLEPPDFPPPTGPTEALEVARRSWEEKVRSEYLGVVIFRHLHDLLINLSAPLDIQQLAITLMAHESHHALLCLEAAHNLGAGKDYVFDRAELVLPRSRDALPIQLVDHIVTVLCCGELVAYQLLTWTVAQLPPSPYRQILTRILKDEVLHARVGYTLLRSIKNDGWCPWPGEEHVRQVISKYEQALRVRDVVDEEEVALFKQGEATDVLLHLGVPPPEGFREVYFSAIPSVWKGPMAELGI